MLYVHEQCLQRWIKVSKNPRSASECDQCKKQYAPRSSLHCLAHSDQIRFWASRRLGCTKGEEMVIVPPPQARASPCRRARMIMLLALLIGVCTLGTALWLLFFSLERSSILFFSLERSSTRSLHRCTESAVDNGANNRVRETQWLQQRRSPTKAVPPNEPVKATTIAQRSFDATDVVCDSHRAQHEYEVAGNAQRDGSASANASLEWCPDNSRPSIVCPAHTAIECVTNEQASVHFMVWAMDKEDGNLNDKVVCTHKSGESFSLGTTMVSCLVLTRDACKPAVLLPLRCKIQCRLS